MFCRAAVLVCFCLLSFACSSRSKPPQRERIGVLTIQNLSSDPAIDWLGRALSGMIAAQASGAQLRVFEVGTEREAWAARATQTLDGYLTVDNGAVHVVAYLRDGRKNLRMLKATASLADSPIKIADTLARELAPGSRRFATQNREAIRNFYSANPLAGVGGILEAAGAAASADPSFGRARLVQAEALLALGRREEAVEAARAASSANLTELDRAQLDVVKANTSGDLAERAAALRKLALLSDDVQIWQSIADIQFIRKDCLGAADALVHATGLVPEGAQFWNLLAYARACTGKLDAAKQALDEYRKLAPNDPNVFDSLGEVYFMNGRFAQAEAYFSEGVAKNPAALGGAGWYRAAVSRLMTGDLGGADRHFAQYLALRKSLKDDLAEVRQAVWLWQTGRRSASEERLRGELERGGDVACVAAAQLLLIEITGGPVTPARLRQFATTQCRGAQARAIAGSVFAMGSTPAPQGPADLQSYWLLLHGKYTEAAAALRPIYDRTPVTAGGDIKTLLGWALTGSGRQDEASRLLFTWPPPAVGADPGIRSLLFPRILWIKGTADRNQALLSLYQRLQESNSKI